MQKVGFPPIRGGILINTIASREPPSRSWSRYKKLLIDNPKDDNLLQRQKLWNFQKLNRGAFRSQITSLPDIPYRVKQNTVEKASVGVQANLPNRYGRGLRVLFPNLTTRDGTSTSADYFSDSDGETKSERNKACSPMHLADEYDYEDDFEDDSSVDDPGFEFDTVVRKKNTGTMTLSRRCDRTIKKEKRKRPIRDRDQRERKKEKKSILINPDEISRPVSPKAVSFLQDNLDNTDDTQTEKTAPVSVVPKIEIGNKFSNSREASMSSLSADESYVKLPRENVGHSSQLSCDPLSVLDFLSGGRSDRSRMTDRIATKPPKEKQKRRKKVTDPDADRVWFEKIVGDKDIVDVATYENFARTRPNPDSQSDSAADRIVDFTKVYTRRNFTPRINDEFPQYHSLVAKETNSNKKLPPPTINKGKGTRRGLIGIGKSY